ncbi:Bacteriocin-protection, YdeI or OmpD-Associated [Pedobacter westerhofensis]|uniref:Bacteriocin-protection, YdeI or OmpD-Associated n=1 Tax=Pedobacter westerhofensis TaxID=425512 RepID=A0A521E9W9_9SPHI|nr:YdeI/OmpD-associated family protein [Pedobacter westerhofensis]SMO80714.1 Bacteriocin-protection, YdeI or OmpD-Associated [Pedobacter westerhofensis]
MVVFEAEIERYEKMGEKTGWTFVFIPAAVANQIKAGCKKSYRVKGRLDAVEIRGLALTPMGEGNFIIALKASLRKELKKEEGAVLHLELEEDKEFKVEMPADLEMCLLEERHCMENFMKLPKGHQNYYINWLNTAKTEPTRIKRLTQIVVAMDKQMDFGTMIRSNRES